jgi:DNA modification methylase/glutaredoxin
MTNNLKIEYVPIDTLLVNEKNPRKWSKEQKEALKESIIKFGAVDPILVNSNEERKNIVIGGHFRLDVCKELGYTEVPVVFLNLTSEKEAELNIRLNKNLGEWNFELLAEFDESLLSEIGFSSEELDNIFSLDDKEESFNLEEQLKKLNIQKINAKKGDVYELDGSRLMVGDSTIEEDMLKLCGGEKVDMVMTDPPYRLDYLNGKTRHGKPTEGFGSKKNRKYLETDILPDDFTEKWMANVFKVANENFSIICYENWKNIREIWNCMEKYWRVRNMIVWHLPNRNQGYAGAHKFFSKHDIAMVGTSEKFSGMNEKAEKELLQNEYETALFAIQGKPHWESYGKGKKFCPTDFIEFNAADEKSSGQAIIFGVKPIEILIPYIKNLTKRGQVVLEPFAGSGSTLIASTKLERRCFIMEKSPVYAEVVLDRWEKLTGKKRKKIN